MSYTVTQEDILTIRADAAVISVENAMVVAQGAANESLAAAGGETLRNALRARRFLPVGSAWAAAAETLPFRQILATAAPRWWDGECNELVVLRRCYQSVFALAEELGCLSAVLPFLSAAYYRFPPEEAVKIALDEAEKTALRVCFCAETPELFALSREERPRPRIEAYLGYHRDHAVFRLDNGVFARVDLRPEMHEVQLRRFVDACYYEEYNRLQPPLAAEEIDRLRAICESCLL